MFVDFETRHLSDMRLADEIRNTLGKFPARSQLEQLAQRGLAFTIVAGETILGIVGAVPRTEQTAEVFLVISKDGKRHVFELVKDVRRVLSVARQQFQTVEALGSDLPVRNRFFSWLGFKRHRNVGSDKLMWRLA